MNKTIRLSTHDLPKEATHPGEFLHDELKARKMTQRQLASLVKTTPSVISEIVHGKRGVSVEMALRLEQMLDISAEFWMKAQISYEINVLHIKRREELAKTKLPDEKRQSLSATI